MSRRKASEIPRDEDNAADGSCQKAGIKKYSYQVRSKGHKSGHGKEARPAGWWNTAATSNRFH